MTLREKFRIRPNKGPRQYDHIPDEVVDDDGVVMDRQVLADEWSLSSPVITSSGPTGMGVTVRNNVYSTKSVPVLCDHCQVRLDKGSIPMNINPLLDYGEQLRTQEYVIRGVYGMTEVYEGPDEDDDDPALD